MLFKKSSKQKAVMVVVIVAVFLSLFASVYALRLRSALIRSTEDYKIAIIALEERITKLKDKTQRLEKELATEIKNDQTVDSVECQESIGKLEHQILLRETYITNEFARNYKLKIEPSSVSLNNLSVENPSNVDQVEFLVIGHPYGGPSNKGAVTPSKTLIDFVPEINRLNPNIIFTLGDLTYSPSEKSYQELHDNFLSRIFSPILNAPGNHDFARGRSFYENHFGQTFYYFEYGQSQIIVLDTEIGSCFVVGRQKEMLLQAIDDALKDDNISQIFVFMHKALFLDDETQLRSHVNSRCVYGTNYDELRDEIFLTAAELKPVYLIAGDVGAFGGNLSPFYAKDDFTDFYTFAVGLGDSPSDVALQINIQEFGVDFELLSVGGQQFAPIETYTFDYWAKP